jgi:hypothetical protein
MMQNLNLKYFITAAIAAFSYLFFVQIKVVPSEKTFLMSATNPTSPPDLFDADSVLSITLSGDMRSLLNDRKDAVQYHPVLLSYTDKEKGEISIRLKARTRGHFRRLAGNCTYPPLLLNFPKKQAQSSIFSNQAKLKLVCPCSGEQYVIREYLVYKLFNLITPKSYRARLTRVILKDSVRKKETSFYGMLLEQDEQMAERNHSVLIAKQQIRGENTDTASFLKMALFQYMIGNTDWSVPYFHNTVLIAKDSFSIPSVVPYDFDHSGLVDAPYARPAEELSLTSVRERRFRGYCISDITAFQHAIDTFNMLKKDIYNLYINCPLIDSKYLATTLKFFEQFYNTINNPKKLRAAFSYPCNNANIVIQGMK